MAVTEDEKGGGRMGVQILLGEDDKRFVGFALKGFFRFYVVRKDIAQGVPDFTVFGDKKPVAILSNGIPAMLQPTGFRPTETELHAPVGGEYVAEEPLA